MNNRRDRTNQIINFSPKDIANAAANTNQPDGRIQPDSRIPAGSDYDLDKVHAHNEHEWTPATTSGTLREIVYNGVFNGRSFESICCELIALHEKKNKDYGGAFYKSMSKFGVVSVLSILDHKFNRLESLFKNGKAEVTDESFEDTLRDIACYAIMGLEHLYNTPQP